MKIIEDEWAVNVDVTDSGKVHIYPTKGLLSFMYGPLPYYIEWVSPPDWIDRLLNHSFEWKVKRSIKRTQEWCDAQNRKESKARNVAEKALRWKK